MLAEKYIPSGKMQNIVSLTRIKEVLIEFWTLGRDKKTQRKIEDEDVYKNTVT